MTWGPDVENLSEPKLDEGGWPLSVRVFDSSSRRPTIELLAPSDFVRDLRGRENPLGACIEAVHSDGAWHDGSDMLVPEFHRLALRDWPELAERPLEATSMPSWADILRARYPELSDDEVWIWLTRGDATWTSLLPELPRVPRWQATMPPGWREAIRERPDGVVRDGDQA